jgi:outer membrane protein OmpA-like peptidoglycan-associated protein
MPLLKTVTTSAYQSLSKNKNNHSSIDLATFKLVQKTTTLILFVLFALTVSAQIRVNELGDVKKVNALVKNYFLGDGIQITKVRYRGNAEAIGSFTDNERITGFGKGIVLSTGRIELIAGKNSRPNSGANFADHFFFDEDLLTKASQCDGAVLEIDFIPESDSLCFAFVFGSEEYPEFVGKEFNDMFQLLLEPMFIKTKPKNLAILPNKKMINVNNVNHLKNAELYIDNTIPSSPYYNKIEFDGFLKPIYAGTRVIKGKPYRLKIMVVDLEDCEYDSGVLLEAYSLRSLSTKHIKYEAITRTYKFNFASNKYDLNPKEQLKTQKLIDSLSRFSFDSILVIGHTDNSGYADSNQILSYNRALYLTQLFEQSNLRCSKYVAIGEGSSKPLTNNQTEKNKALNRRVEIIFYRKAK